MTIKRDPRYDILLVDTDYNGQTANEQLGLILHEAAGDLAFAVSHAPPIQGLPNADLQDYNTSRYTARTQRNWQGGLGREYTYDRDVNSFYQGVADTRFRNAILLPPRATATQVSGGTDPQFLPTDPGVSVTDAYSAFAYWSSAGRNTSSDEVRARWSNNGRSENSETAQATFSFQQFKIEQQQQDTILGIYNIAANNYQEGAQSFTPPHTFQCTQLELYLYRGASTSFTYQVSIRTDSNNTPNAYVWNVSLSGSTLPTSAQWVSFSPNVTLNGGTKYWIHIAILPFSQNGTVWWGAKYNNPFTNGTLRYVSHTTGGSWSDIGNDPDATFRINGGNWITGTKTRRRLAQSFTVGSSNVNMTSVQLYLDRTQWESGAQAWVKLWANSSGAPGNELASATMADPGSSAGWKTTNISYTLLANTTYWIGIEFDAATSDNEVQVRWYGDTQGLLGQCRESTNTGSGWSAWSVVGAGSSRYFKINTGYPNTPFFDQRHLTRRRLAQSFLTIQAINMTQVKLLLQTAAWSGSPTLTLHLCQNASGNPGSIITSASVPNPGASGWKTIAMSASLAASTTYWLVLEADAPTINDDVVIYWSGDANQSYNDGAGKAVTVDTQGTWPGWGTWSNASLDFYFIINNYSGQHPFFSTHYPIRKGLSMSFQTPPGGLQLQTIRIYGRITTFAGSPTITVRLLDDNGELGTATIPLVAHSSPQWISIPLSLNLAASAYHYIQIHVETTDIGNSATIVWMGDNNNSYVGGWSGQRDSTGNGLQWGSWYDAKDLFFIINNGSPLVSPITIQPLRFNNQWYAAAGTAVYRWNTSTNKWDLVYNATSNVTALAHLGGKIYAALGDSTNMVESTTGNSGSWSATSGNRQYTFLRAFNGFLYAAKSTGGANALAYTNGTTWVTNLTVGTSDVRITGLANFQNELVILSTRALFSLSSSFVYQIYDLSTEEDDNNGRNAIPWLVDGRLYVPVRNGLNAYNGVSMENVGPNFDEGLPVGERGRIAAMVGTKTFLFAAIDAGTNGTSGIYAFNGQGWHCLAKATASGKRIRAIGIETITSSTGMTRLWWFEDSVPYYVELPDLSDNPYNYTGAKFAQTGNVTSSRFGGELPLIEKDFYSIGLWTEGCSNDQFVDVYYEVDNSGIFVYAGRVTQSPFQELILEQGDHGVKTVTTGSTDKVINVLATETTGDMEVGEFVRIGNEIRQISTINSTTQFTLATPLDNVPSTGTKIYPSGPVGKSIRYRLVLSTNNLDLTPKVVRVTIWMMPRLIAKARISFSPVIEDDLKMRNGADYGMSANDLRVTLYDRWIKRTKPFTIVDPTGKNWRVKVSGVEESGFTRQEIVPASRQRFSSRMRIVCDEV